DGVYWLMVRTVLVPSAIVAVEVPVNVPMDCEALLSVKVWALALLRFRLPVPRPDPLATVTLPALMVTAPVQLLFGPLMLTVPVPALLMVSVPPPVIAPLRVAPLLSLTVRVGSPTTAMLLAELNELLTDKAPPLRVIEPAAAPKRLSAVTISVP